MNLRISPKAREYILTEGGVITAAVEKRLMKGCDLSRAEGCPVAKMGGPLPEEQAQYLLQTIADVAVYVHTTMQEYDQATPLLLDLETTLFGYNLKIYGGPVMNSCLGCSAC